MGKDEYKKIAERWNKYLGLLDELFSEDVEKMLQIAQLVIDNQKAPLVAQKKEEKMETISKRDFFAIQLLQKLMDRHNEPGYEETYSVYESYRLADLMINLSALRKTTNKK